MSFNTKPQYITPKENISEKVMENLDKFAHFDNTLFDKKFKKMFKNSMGEENIKLTLEIPIIISPNGIYVGESKTKIGLSEIPENFIKCKSGIDILVEINKEFQK